ncbi:DNA replication/repair protein RecF, partial [Rickettsiales bacterium]|nr:DNA replication/repair protein RecF [Rickettsiales bacterium]
MATKEPVTYENEEMIQGDKSLSSLYCRKSKVSELNLTNYRNYNQLSLKLDGSPVVITGRNGAGKTNILESISFLSPGRGLRSSKLDIVGKIDENGNSHPWAISSRVDGPEGDCTIGTGVVSPSDNTKRIIKIDGEQVKGQGALTKVFQVMWLTPQMDGLFISGSSERRKFLDRLVYNFDSEHASRVYSYEHTMRERMKLLQQNGDAAWLSILEKKMAEKAVAIAAARLDAVDVISKSIKLAPTAFPKAKIKVKGEIEEFLSDSSALESEEYILKKLYQARQLDRQYGRTNFGTHRSDLSVIHIDKNMPAMSCSTGEQKALLLSIILAEARAKSTWNNSTPVLLLDEVIAHLDEFRRNSLFDEILA